MRLKTKAFSNNGDRMGRIKATTIKGEIRLFPIDFGVVVAKPI